MTTEHLRPLLDEWSSVQVLFKAGEVFARAEIPDTVIQMVKMGRLTVALWQVTSFGGWWHAPWRNN